MRCIFGETAWIDALLGVLCEGLMYFQLRSTMPPWHCDIGLFLEHLLDGQAAGCK